MSKRLTSAVSTPAPPSIGDSSLDDHDVSFLPLDDGGTATNIRERSGTETSIESVDLALDDDDPSSKKNKNKNHNTKTRAMARICKSLGYIRSRSRMKKIDGKQVVLCVLVMLFMLLIWDAMIRAPEDRILKPDFSNKFLAWVQSNPAWGLVAILIVIAGAVVTMVPIGTPLVVGCGYIYRGVYGWGMGLFVATAVAMAGSTLGAVTCFLLGRYLMRERVQKWVRKYPLFDAIDVGRSFHDCV